MPRQVLNRSFLERHTHDSIQLQKLISAMLTSEAACGGSETLLGFRKRFLYFFGVGNLPDPTTLGYNVLSLDDWIQKFDSSLRRYYHHVSEKHCGELIQMKLESLGTACGHPMVCDVHSSQFFRDSEENHDIVKWSEAFFKNKWWRADTKHAEWEREKFIKWMRWYDNTVWRPMVESDNWTSGCFRITWHSLDSLVWMFVTRADPLHLQEVTFAELYLYFCKVQILTHKRVHSTKGRKTQEKKKVQPAANPVQPAANPISASGQI
jgi:hypothetical protein